jgi:hypothetical protein
MTKRSSRPDWPIDHRLQTQPLSQSSRADFHLECFAQPHRCIHHAETIRPGRELHKVTSIKDLLIWLAPDPCTRFSSFSVSCLLSCHYHSVAILIFEVHTLLSSWQNTRRSVRETCCHPESDEPALTQVPGRKHICRTFQVTTDRLCTMQQQKMHPATAQIDAGQIPLRSSDQSGFQLVFASIPILGVQLYPFRTTYRLLTITFSVFVKFREK